MKILGQPCLWHFHKIELNLLKKDGIFEDNIETDDETISAIASNVDIQIRSFPKISNKIIDTEISNTSIGILVIPIGTDKDNSRIKNYINYSKKNKIPILFSRNSNPYSRIGIKLTSDLSEESVSRVALDIAQKIGATIVAYEVREPEFFSQEHSPLFDSHPRRVPIKSEYYQKYQKWLLMI